MGNHDRLETFLLYNDARVSGDGLKQIFSACQQRNDW